MSRLPYAAAPPPVHAWVEERLGSPVVAADEQSGGMSPGCATRLTSADGSRAFVKAVGPELNPDTPTLFRREAATLRLIGDHPRWASLLASYDDPRTGWVALLLEDVEGTRPDLGDARVAERVLEATDDLGRVLADRVPDPPAPDPTPWPGTERPLDLRVTLRTWARSFAVAAEAGALPPWLLARTDELAPGVAGLPDLAGDAVQHWDVRDDNLLVRPDGEVVFVDWGNCGVGPGVLDPLLARLQRAHLPWFDDSLSHSPALTALGETRDEVVTSFLVGFGAHLAWRARTATDVNLPRLRAFREEHATRALGAAARRLGAT